MTGGQYSPTTPRESYATTSPYGNFENAFDLSRMAIAAGASYVARSTTYHFLPTQNFVMRGLENSGFSFIEVLIGMVILQIALLSFFLINQSSSSQSMDAYYEFLANSLGNEVIEV